MAKVATPAITINSSNKVQITCSTGSAAIYYTLDGTEPTAESLQYTAPFDYPTKKLIKAIGILADNDNSEVAEYQCYKLLLQSMVSKANKIYKITDDYDLGGKQINVMQNACLQFDGGSMHNGTIEFRQGSNIINNTEKTVFYDIIFSRYSQLSINCHFVDNWHNNPMLGTNNILANVPHFYFTTDYIIEDDAHFQHGVNYRNIPHYLHGNGHKLTMLTHNFTGKSTFLQGESIAIDNLSIICESNDIEEHIGTVFNCRNFTADNLFFDAYNRLTANWSYDDHVDHTNSFLILRQCNIRTSSFVMEGRYDRMDIVNTQLLTRTDRSDYGHDIISTRAYNSNPNATNAYICIANSIVEGGIELVGVKPEDRTNTYKTVTVTNSLLRYFRLGFHGGIDYGITDMEVINCISYVGKGNGFYNGINSVVYRHCTFYLTTYNSYALGPFKILSMRAFTFDSCKFFADAANTTVSAPICETHESTIYQEDFADNLSINIINCDISTNWLNTGRLSECISLQTSNIVFTDEQAERAINIINTKIVDTDINVATVIATIVYSADDGPYKPRLLPIHNFRMSYEVLRRLRLNMLKGKNVHGSLYTHAYKFWGNRYIPITYMSDIQQFVQDNGITWNSLRPLL